MADRAGPELSNSDDRVVRAACIRLLDAARVVHFQEYEEDDELTKRSTFRLSGCCLGAGGGTSESEESEEEQEDEELLDESGLRWCGCCL